MVKSDVIVAGSNTAIAVAKLRAMIFSGELGAGTDHLESELADRLGMSRTPVREALLRLEAQGLVEVRPRKGARIKPLSPSDMAEIYDILTELESLAAAKAAERNLPEAELMTLTSAIQDMEDALARDDREAWAAADDVFHHALTHLSGNARIVQISGMLADQVRRARMVTLYMRPAPTRSNEDHAKVVNAIRQGDPVAARNIHRAHRMAAKEILLELLQRHRLSSI
ncbi:MAG: GntR family transcriptional regulator [Pseudomonadota bacterium]